MKETIANKYRTLQEDLKKKVSTGKLDGYSLADIDCIIQVGKELLCKHITTTCLHKVAEYFKRFGFLVTKEFNGVSFVIAE